MQNMTNNIMLKMTDIHKSFGELEVLRGIDFSVAIGYYWSFWLWQKHHAAVYQSSGGD